jgi:hypothetical protein
MQRPVFQSKSESGHYQSLLVAISGAYISYQFEISIDQHVKSVSLSQASLHLLHVQFEMPPKFISAIL